MVLNLDEVLNKEQPMPGEKYAIRISSSAERELASVPKAIRVAIIRAIDEQLSWEPFVQTRNRKPLVELIPPWEQGLLPVWELRVGEHRVFYDTDGVIRAVTVRAVRHKPPHRTTEDIL